MAAVVLALVAYASIAHYCNANRIRPLGTALALAPPLCVGLGLVWRYARRAIALASTLAAALLLYDVWPRLQQNFPVIYLVQDCAMYGLLGAGFARSLRPGDTALCTRLADQLHGPLTAAEVRYSRQVTVAWAIFFATLTLTILALYWLAPLEAWSLFANFAVIPLIALMFLVEYSIRLRVLPATDRRGVLAGLKVFLAMRSRG